MQFSNAGMQTLVWEFHLDSLSFFAKISIVEEQPTHISTYTHNRIVSANLFFLIAKIYSFRKDGDVVHSSAIGQSRTVSLPMRCARGTHITGCVATKSSWSSYCFGSLHWRCERRGCGQRVFGVNPALASISLSAPVYSAGPSQIVSLPNRALIWFQAITPVFNTAFSDHRTRSVNKKCSKHHSAHGVWRSQQQPVSLLTAYYCHITTCAAIDVCIRHFFTCGGELPRQSGCGCGCHST